jgi:murein DD-endopeptidase MepM/ murein hydrolase activator NlpD
MLALSEQGVLMRLFANDSYSAWWHSKRAVTSLAFGVICGMVHTTAIAYAIPSQKVDGARGILTSSFVYPLMGPRESSDYGVRKHPIKRDLRHHHDGIDLAAPSGAIIRSIAAGRVMYSDPFGGYGNLVVIKHESGLTSHYGHCQTLKVRVGQVVRAGDIIATVGSTGRSTGPHLHFEIRKNGEPQHPERLLPGLADPTQG